MLLLRQAVEGVDAERGVPEPPAGPLPELAARRRPEDSRLLAPIRALWAAREFNLRPTSAMEVALTPPASLDLGPGPVPARGSAWGRRASVPAQIPGE